MADIKEQLQFLKATTIRTNGIHEAQGLQMKRWVLLFPEATVQSKVRVDPEDKTVYYLVSAPKYDKGDIFDKTCKAIEEYTRWLLWNESRIVVKVNGKKVYESK